MKLQDFAYHMESLRQQTIQENHAVIVVMKNGVAASTIITPEFLSATKDQTVSIGMEVRLLLNKVTIHGGDD